MATILHVDDEPSISLILQDTLERAGHTADRRAQRPRGAAGARPGEVDLIISDYRMPGLTGLEFLSLLRARDTTSR
jgi:CheY-like chemotaxis protein